jgi:hypothetical protein
MRGLFVGTENLIYIHQARQQNTRMRYLLQSTQPIETIEKQAGVPKENQTNKKIVHS